MDPQLVNETITLLEEKFGPIGQKIWKVYTEQVVIDGILGTVMPWAIFVLLLYCIKRIEKSELEGDEKFFFILLFSLFAITAFLFGLLYLRYLINPEYFAAQRLLAHAVP